MKILEKQNMVAFNCLYAGDVFREADGTYWMKTEPIDEWIDPDCSGIRNAVNIVDGTWCFVNEEAQVGGVSLTLNIRHGAHSLSSVNIGQERRVS